MSEALGELDGAWVRIRPDGEVGQFLGLRRGGRCELLAPVSGLHGEQPGQAVEVAIALVVPDVGALASDDHGDMTRAVVVVRVAGEVHPQVVARLVGQRVGAGLSDELR